tara:strand:+ start:1842 stop:2600 length:759 start_codon:yes stop_codon:yes gene_type:complete
MKKIIKKDLFDLKNKIVVVTGSEGKIGSYLKKNLEIKGAKVYGIGLQKKNKKNYFKGNVGNEKNIKKILNKIIKIEKKIDVIINNAGVSVFTPMEKRTNKEIDYTINCNLKGTINIVKNYFVLHKKKKLKHCKIINIGSIYGLVSPDLRVYSKGDNINSEIYGATKAGIIQLTKYYAAMFGKYNILVNCISPGGLSDKAHSQKFINNYNKRVPMNRFGIENDLLGAIIYFASDSCSYTTGQNLVIDGGLTSW